jgi:predicted TIM-barrel fold metal-dependent hydrolase
MLPTFYVEALKASGHNTSALPEWTPEVSLELMDSMGMEKAILSVSSPGATDPELARSINEYGAQLINDYPGRFGAFACLPFPNVEASVCEVEHALDELHLDGVILFSNVNGGYLGDPEYDAILEALNLRSATVFVHANDRPGIETNDAFNAFVEYPTDVARAYARLVFSHAFTRFPNIRFIFANAGGVVPFLAERIGKLHYLNGAKMRWGRIIVDLVTKRNGGLDLAKSVSYDVADSCSPFTLRALEKLVNPEQVLFGSNFPWSSEAQVAKSIETLGRFDSESRLDESEKSVA